MAIRSILERLWTDEGVSATKANYPLWVMAHYIRGHGGFGALQPYLADLESITLAATVRALGSYDPAKGALASWLRLLIEQELGDYLEREARNSTAGGHGLVSYTVQDQEDEVGDGSRLDALAGGVEQVERETFEAWRRRVVEEAVRELTAANPRQGKAVFLYFRLDAWPYRRTDADVADLLGEETAVNAKKLRQRGVEALRGMGLPRELLEDDAGSWLPVARARRPRPNTDALRARGLNGPVVVRHDPSIIRRPA
jgi:hypothetical protein